MSQTLVQRPTPVHDFSSREIINVDDLVPGSSQDDDVQLITHRPVRSTHEPIVIEDSDDEVEIVAGPSRVPPADHRRAGQQRPGRLPSRRTLFSPPPPPQDNYIPPVPPLPPHARDEPPLRWRLPEYPPPPPPVRPLEQPFVFEQGFAERQLPPIHNNAQRGPLVGAAVQNAARRPNMGLGGALVALNRRNELQRPREEQNNAGWGHLLTNFALGPFRLLFQQGGNAAEPDNPQPFAQIEDDDPDLLEALALDAEERQFQLRLYQRRALQRNRNVTHQRNKEEPGYKFTFTHPAKPEVGFSNDFAPREAVTISDGPGPSSSLTNDAHTGLVCAKCLDPLLINVIGSEEESRKRRLFALRCGHILDGQCIDELMKPPVPVSDENATGDSMSSQASKEKGKAMVDDPVGFPGFMETSIQSTIEVGPVRGPVKKNKGKQKAVSLQEQEPPSPSIPAKRPQVEEDDPLDLIRGRLRPRLGGNSASGPNLAGPSSDLIVPATNAGADSLLDHVSRTGNTRRRGGGRRGATGGRTKRKGKGKDKGKGKAAPPVIEEVYEWLCPVSNCGCKHKSVRILGVWRMDEEDGAIAMFV